MPSMPPERKRNKVPKRRPGATTEPERRSRSGSAPSEMMQSYDKISTAGKAKIFAVGVAMLGVSGGVGLFADALSFYRFIIVILFAIGGIGFVFPHWGIVMADFIKGLVGKVKRPDRRE